MVSTEKIWDFADEDQKQKMLEDVIVQNCGEKLLLIRNISGMSRKDLARAMGCSESTIARIELKQSLPTDQFMLRLAALSVIGREKYSKMSDAEKEKISEILGASGGVVTGIGGAIGAISMSGAVAGMSAAGITSGLAAIGGTMLGGLAVVATIPLAVGFAGFGLVKGIKAICAANKLSCTEVDGIFEISRDTSIEEK